jgi:probable phosphoglycerate mutase
MASTTDGQVPQRPFSLPPGATEIIVVRHGASAAAVPGTPFPLVDGRGDPPLSDTGHAQAQAVRARLEAERVDRIFVTTLQRTAQTAAPLASALSLTPVVVPELAEVHLGAWEGGEYRIRAAQGDPLVRRVFEQERWDVIPGAEPEAALEARVRAGLARIVAETGPDASAVAVLHGGIIGELCRIATRSRPFAFIHADNCSVSRLVAFADGSLLLRSFNDISHLPVAAATGPAG